MKKICGIALAALLAACGTDSDGTGGNGGSGGGGGGGGGGNELPDTPIVVENDAGRVFGGEAMTITIEEQASDIPFVLVELVTTEYMADGSPSLGFYELVLRSSGDMVIDGQLTSVGLFTEPPEAPGRGMIQVGFTDGDGEFGAGQDVISLQLDAGTVTGGVTSESKPEVAASIAGSYTMSCSTLDGNTLVPDPDFTSDFCKQFAHRLPAD